MTELEFTKELLQIQNYLLNARDDGIESAWEITSFLLQDLIEKVIRETSYFVRAGYACRYHGLFDIPEFKELVQEVEKHTGNTIEITPPKEYEKYDWDWVDMRRNEEDEEYYNFNRWNPGSLF